MFAMFSADSGVCPRRAIAPERAPNHLLLSMAVCECGVSLLIRLPDPRGRKNTLGCVFLGTQDNVFLSTLCNVDG